MSDSGTPLPWFAEGLRFACTQCGNCCSGAPGYVWVTGDDARRIATFLGLTEDQFYRRHVRTVGRGHSLLELPGGDCEFLERTPNGKTRCRIHSVRPVQCRTWPFWKSNLESPETWTQAARHCPGINKGELHSLSAIATALRENGHRPL